MPRSLCWWWLGLVLQDTRPASAPGATRERLLGETRDAAGQPWPGARVTLLTRTWPDWDDIGVCDRIEAVSDAQGRFRAELLPCRWYSAFAQEVLADGTARMSTVAEWVTSGPHLILSAERALRTVTDLLIEGLPKGSAPVLRVRLPLVHTLLVPVALDASGRAAVPPWPGASATLELLDGRGQLLRTRALLPQAARPNQPWRWRAAEPLEREIRVTDVDIRPVPEASVWLHYRALGTLLPLGTTSAAGLLRFRGPAFDEEPDADLSLLVTVPGFAAGPITIRGNSEDVSVILPPAASLRGRILGADGAPVSNRTCLVYSPDVECTGPVREVVHAGPARPRRVTTGAHGEFVVDGLAEHVSYVLEMEARDLGLPAIAPRVVLACGRTGAAGTAVTLGHLGPARLHTLALQVQSPDGAPVAHPRIAGTVYGELDQGDLMRWAAGSWLGNARGQVQLLVPPAEWGIAVQADPGRHWAAVRKLGSEPARRAEPVTLTQARPLRGRIKDADGRPCAGWAVTLVVRTESDWLRQHRVEMPGDFVRNFQLDLLRNKSAWCDDEGRFTHWLLPLEGVACFLQAGPTLPDAWMARPQPLPADPAAVVELVGR